MPATINWWGQKRVYSVLHREPWQFHDLFELTLKSVLSFRGPVVDGALSQSQSTFEIERRGGGKRRGDQESRLTDVDLFLADFGRQVRRIAGFQQVHQSFEIGALAGVKLPTVIDRQLYLGRSLCAGSPRRLQ